MAKASARGTAPPVPPKPAAAPTMPWAAPGSLDPQHVQPYGKGERAHYLTHTPGNYVALDGWCVPDLRPLYAGQGGVNGVMEVRRPGQNPVADPRNAIAAVTAKGGKVIPWDVDAGEGHPSYLVEVPNTGTWAHRLQRLVPGMPPQPPEPGVYAEWLVSLMDRDILPRPHPEMVKAVGDRLGRLAASQASSKNPRALEQLQAQHKLYTERALTKQVSDAAA